MADSKKAGRLAIASLLLGLFAGAANGASVEDSKLSEELKALLAPDAPGKAAGAHRQSDPHANLDADKMAQVALRHLDEGRAQLAFDTLNEAIGRFPGSAMLLSLRASLFLQKRQTSLALADLNRAIDIEPHDPILFTNRAQALRQFGRDDDARHDLDQALRLDETFIAAHFNRGSLYFEAGEYDRALADFNRCIELDPAIAACYFNRASTYEATGKREQAVSDLQHFLTLSPEENWAQFARDLLKQWNPDLS